MDYSIIDLASPSPDQGNDNHQNEPSSVTPANASQAVALQEPTFAVSLSLSKNVSANGARADKAEAKRKRDVDDEIAHTTTRKRVGPSVESYDGWLRELEAGKARRAALSPEARKKEDIKGFRGDLRDHLEPQLICDWYGLPVGLHHYPRFILQLAPHSRNGSTCRFNFCTDRIKPGQYRIALTSGMSDLRGPDYYHVRCFENLLDMSSPHYAARFDADKEKHIPDRGAQCILEEYISRWKLRIAQAQNYENPSFSTVGERVGAGGSLIVRLRAHLSTAKAVGQQEVSAFLQSLADNMGESESAPNDSDGVAPIGIPSDSARARQLLSAIEAAVEKDKWAIADILYERVRKAETEKTRQYTRIFRHSIVGEDSSGDESRHWNITQYLLSEIDPKYSKRHTLSQALKAWDNDVTLATTELNKLTEAGRQAQAALPIEKIRRYNSVPMPSYWF